MTDLTNAELDRLVERLEALEVELEGERQRAADAEHRLYAFRQGRAARSKALTEFIKARAPDLWPDYAAVSVNGSIYSDKFTIEPTYEREMNILRARAEKAEETATTLRARIAEDQAQIVALTTYKENLRDEVVELRARIAELEAFQQQAIKQVCELAREAGEAKGKLEASELPGIVDGWREKCERLERRVAELEACLEIDPAHPYDGIADENNA